MPRPEAAGRVLIALQHLSGPLLKQVETACRELCAPTLLWDGNESPPLPRPPVLAIAALEVGSRRVPEDLVRLVTRSFPGLPLLLLCNESLTRSSISLQDGRLTLLGPRISLGRLKSQLHLMLMERQAAPPPEPGREEILSPAVWAASVTLGATEAEPGWIPRLVEEPGQGCSVLIGLSGATSFSPAKLSEISALLLREEPLEVKESALKTVVGAHSGILHLSPEGDELLCYWPDPTQWLGLYSAQRLPAATLLSQSILKTGAPLFRLAAHAGDLLFGIGGPAWSRAGGRTVPLGSGPLRDALGEGGPSFLDYLSHRLAAAAKPVFGLVLEVR